jgi:hypothetical protein
MPNTTELECARISIICYNIIEINTITRQHEHFAPKYDSNRQGTHSTTADAAITNRTEQDSSFGAYASYRRYNKGFTTKQVVSKCEPETCIIAIDDNIADEGMFAALPSNAFSILVGTRPSIAKSFVPMLSNFFVRLQILKKSPL